MSKLPELKIPLIPPKTIPFKAKFDFNEDEEIAEWYYVQSPREKNGAVGPFPLSDLRNLYKVGEIGDTTLMWKEGLEHWDQLKDLPTLRHKLVYLPLIPPRLGSTFEDATVNPIMNPPAAHIAAKFEDIDQYRVSHSCSRCGNFALNHVHDAENILPAFGFLRSEIGSSKEFSEIIPGFLFIGNAASARPNVFNRLSTTLLINCTDNLKDPKPRPPYYRCKQVPLRERLVIGAKDTHIADRLKKKALIAPTYEQVNIVKVDAHSAHNARNAHVVNSVSKASSETDSSVKDKKKLIVPVYDGYQPFSPGAPGAHGLAGPPSSSVGGVPRYDHYNPVNPAATTVVETTATELTNESDAKAGRANRVEEAEIEEPESPPEVPLTAAHFRNIIDFGYSDCATKDRPELLSPLEPLIHYFNLAYNWIEYERVTEAPTIQKADMYATVVTTKITPKPPKYDHNGDLIVDPEGPTDPDATSATKIVLSTKKPILPWKTQVDKYGRPSGNGLEKVENPKGRPRTPQKADEREQEAKEKLERKASIAAISSGKSPPGSAIASIDRSKLVKNDDKASARAAKSNAAIAASQIKPRVLVWSSLGFDRSVAVVVAYLIRRWNISIDQSIALIKRHRPGIQISPLHMRALQRWEDVFLSGNFICVDCLIKSGGYDVNNPDKHHHPAIVVNDIVSNNTGLHVSKLDRARDMVSGDNDNSDLMLQLGMMAGGSGALGGTGASNGISKSDDSSVNSNSSSTNSSRKRVAFALDSRPGSPGSSVVSSSGIKDYKDRPDKWDGNPVHVPIKAIDLLERRTDKLSWIENIYKKLELEAASHYSTSHAIHADTHMYTILGTPRVYLHAVRTEAYQLPLISVNAGAHGYKWSDNSDYTQYQAQAAEVEVAIATDVSQVVFRKIDVVNLCDISLPGRNLTDVDVTILMEALLNVHIVAQIRNLELQNNNIGDLGAESISTAFVVPTACFDEDINLMYLNLESNWIGPAGAVHIATFLRSNISLITLNMANNRIGDDGGAAIIGVLRIEDVEYVDVDSALMTQAQHLAKHHGQHQYVPHMAHKRPKKNTASMLATVKVSGTMSVSDFERVEENEGAETADGSGTGTATNSRGQSRGQPFRFALSNNILASSGGFNNFNGKESSSNHITVDTGSSSIAAGGGNGRSGGGGIDADDAKYLFGSDMDAATSDAIMSSAIKLTKDVNKMIALEPTYYNYTMTDLNISNNELNQETAEALIEALKTNQTLTSLSIEVTRDFSTRNWKHIYNGLRLYNQSIRKLSLCDSVITPKCFLYFVKIFSSKVNRICDFNLSRCGLLPSHMKYLATTLDSSLLESPCIEKLDLSYNKDIKNDGLVYLALSLCGGGSAPRKKSQKMIDFLHEAEFSSHKRQLSDAHLNEDGTEAPPEMSALRLHEAEGKGGGGGGDMADHYHNDGAGSMSGSLASGSVNVDNIYRSNTGTFVKRKPLSMASQAEEDRKNFDLENTEYYSRDNQISHPYVHHTAMLTNIQCCLMHLDLSCTGIVYFTPKQCIKKRNEDALNHANNTHTGSIGPGHGAGGHPHSAPNLHGSSGVTSASALYSFGILMYVLQKYCPQLVYLDVSHNNLNNAFVVRAIETAYATGVASGNSVATGSGMVETSGSFSPAGIAAGGSIGFGSSGSSCAPAPASSVVPPIHYKRYGESENLAAVAAVAAERENRTLLSLEDQQDEPEIPYVDPENSEERHEFYNAHVIDSLMNMHLEVFKCADCKLSPLSVNCLLLQLESSEKPPTEEEPRQNKDGLFNRFRVEIQQTRESLAALSSPAVTGTVPVAAMDTGASTGTVASTIRKDAKAAQQSYFHIDEHDEGKTRKEKERKEAEAAEVPSERVYTPLSQSLQALYLGKNNIGDAVVDALVTILQTNVKIQILDLTFNQISSACMAKACSALNVTSKSSDALKLTNLFLDLKGNPCDYANSRNTVDISKVGLDLEHSVHSVASIYEDHHGAVRTELRSIPMPGLARSKQTMQYAYNQSQNISNVIDEDGNRQPVGDRMAILHENANAPMPMVEESHHLSIVDNIPFQARKHFTIRKHYQDLYNRESKARIS